MVHKYTPEQVEFIRVAAPGKYNSEIANLFNAQFGTSITESQIKSFKANNKIRSNVPKRRVTDDEGLFTKDQKAFLIKNAKGISNQALTDLVNQKFCLAITVKQIKTWKKNHRLSSGLTGHFEKGHDPVNKGTKGLYNVGGNKTSFQKGQRPQNYKPVGSERVDRDGYLLIKVSDEGSWHERWRHKHKVIWEEVNGPIPAGHALIFADRNKLNLTLENLILVTKSQLARLNQNHLLFEDAELTKTGLIIADIYCKMGELRKQGKEG